MSFTSNYEFYDYYPFNDLYKKLGSDITNIIINMSLFNFNNYITCRGFECSSWLEKNKKYNYCKKCYHSMKKEGYVYCKYCDYFTILCDCEAEYEKMCNTFDESIYYDTPEYSY